MDNMMIGKYIRELRRAKDLTTIDLAEKIGISQPKLSRLENGLQDFPIELLDKICRALKISLSDLFISLEGKEVFGSFDKEIVYKQGNNEEVYDEKIIKVISTLDSEQKSALYSFLISMVKK